MKGCKKKSSSALSTEDFHNHFNNLFSSDDMFSNDDIRDNLAFSENILNNVEQLDIEFSISEIKHAILFLKRQKKSWY